MSPRVSQPVNSDSPTLAKRSEMPDHPLDVGGNAREQLECADGLIDRHAAAVDDAAATLRGSLKQRGLKREIHDLGDPVPLLEKIGIDRQAGMARHARGRRMGEAVGLPQGLRHVVTRFEPAGGMMRRKLRDEPCGALRIDIENPDGLRSERRKRMGYGDTGTARTNQHDIADISLGQTPAKS